MNLRFIDWIWHVRGSLALAPEQSCDDAFDRLDPLFQQTGTSHERTNGTLVFRKKDQAAQDKMSVFDWGILRVEKGSAGSVLRYHLTSRALLFCFLAPLMFLGIAQFTMAVVKPEQPTAEVAGKSGKASDASQKAAAKHADVPMNPIDKALGAPAPEKSGKDGADGPGKRGKKPSPTPAYVFAGIFAALYVIGRILEDRLVRALFRKRLLGPSSSSARFAAERAPRSSHVATQAQNERWLRFRRARHASGVCVVRSSVAGSGAIRRVR